MTKRFLLVLFLFFMTSSVCFSAPNYDPNLKPIVYDVSYNVALRNKLEDDFHKKYTVKIDEHKYVDTSPMGAYAREVLEPYHRLKKPYDYKILST